MFRKLHAKSIRDQLIKGLNDGNTIEEVQHSNVILEITITKCQSREASKKHHTDIIQNSDTVAALHKPSYSPPQVGQNVKLAVCQGCGGMYHIGSHRQCLAFNQICCFCHKVGHCMNK